MAPSGAGRNKVLLVEGSNDKFCLLKDLTTSMSSSTYTVKLGEHLAFTLKPVAMSKNYSNASQLK